ncbi:MAG: hypothetical protein KBD21_01630 [Candidatus Pacebacteria bacterium]|nr:hypothetical protein [Candidatus Paceibacterota bacterium]
MRELTYEQKILMLALVWCMGMCAVYGYAFVYLGTLHEGLHEELAALALKRSEMHAQAQAQDAVKNVSDARAELAEHVVPLGLPTKFLSELETVLSALDLTFDIALTQREEQGVSGVKPILEVVLNVTGTDTQVRDAVRALEELSYVSSVDEFSMNRFDEEGSTMWDGTIRLTALAQ